MHKLSKEQQRQLDNWLLDFDRNWHANRLADYLNELPELGSALRKVTLIEMIKIDLERQWQHGRQVCVEDYLRRYPDLSTEKTVPLDLLCAEIQVRSQWGAKTGLSEFARRFPAQVDELHSLLSQANQTTIRYEQDQLSFSSETTAANVALNASTTEFTQIGPFPIEGEIGRGGMGLVLRGRDTSFQRSLAIKVLLPEHRRNADLARRFLEEAQVIGQLQHPGIPPVHTLGKLDDGRPYFSMKLIRGRTLSALLQGRGEEAETLPYFLGIFEQICQTLAYAHTQGIIHRDLKPANIMVGDFGEVQVMDWGLAKVVRSPSSVISGAEELQAQVIEESIAVGDQLRTTDQEPRTRAGAVMGTPAFMAPEQARGDVDQQDERCDVFGLGAILSIILTGKPPYSATDTLDVFEAARHAKLNDAWTRLERCSADAELVQLAKRTLAADKENRPRHAGEVAEAVEHYQARVQERLRQVELERKTAQIKVAEERKRRIWQLGLAAAVLIVFVLAASGGFWLQAQHARQLAEKARREARLQRGLEAGLDLADKLLRQARWEEAKAVLAQLEIHLDRIGSNDLQQQLKSTRNNLKLIARLDRILLHKSAQSEGGIDYVLADQSYESAFHEHGLLHIGDAAPVAAQRIKKSAIRDQLLAALDDWAITTRDVSRIGWLLHIARQVDPHPWRDKLREMATWKNTAALKRLASETIFDETTPRLLLMLGTILNQKGQDGAGFLKKANEHHPQDFWINVQLAAMLGEEHPQEAFGYCRAAMVARPKCAMVHNALGIAFLGNREFDQALKAFQIARQLDASFAFPHHNEGLVHLAKSDPKMALESFRRALALDPRLVPAQYNEGLVLRDEKDWEGAIRAFRKVIQINPRHFDAYNDLGIALTMKKDVQGGIRAYQKAISINPKFAKAHRNLALEFYKLRDYKQAIRILRKTIGLDPRDDQAHYLLGRALVKLRQSTEAIESYRNAIACNPSVARYYSSLGWELYSNNEMDSAAKANRMAIKLDPKIAMPHNNLGLVLMRQGDLDAAIREFRTAIELNPKIISARVNLAAALFQKKLLSGSDKSKETQKKKRNP